MSDLTSVSHFVVVIINAATITQQQVGGQFFGGRKRDGQFIQGFYFPELRL